MVLPYDVLIKSIAWLYQVWNSLTTVGRLLEILIIFSHTLCMNIIKQFYIVILGNSSYRTGEAANTIKIAHTCVPIIYNHP